MTKTKTILGLMAQTSIHAGTGQNTGVIDLPIQREGHNGWPCVFGSAVKGAMRARAEQVASKDHPSIKIVYGPDTNVTDGHAGAVMFSDARIILFPVRSLTSQFRWITCPAVIDRLKQDMARLDLAVPDISIENNDSAVALSNNDNDYEIFLEEYRFDANTDTDLTDLITLLSRFIKDDKIKENLKQQLLVLSNDMFTYLVQHATPVNAHIVINSENKTTENLWYEESLPPETLLYTTISAVNSRGDSDDKAEKILESVTNLFADKPWFQMGGNETVGMGWCAVADVSEAE